MFARALILLLLVLNVGVAGWWLTRPDAAAPASPAAPQAPTLRLLDEGTRASTSMRADPTHATPPSANAASTDATATAAAAADTATTTETGATDATDATMATAAGERCFRFGPYPSEAAATQARAALPSPVTRSLPATTASDNRGWKVWLPPLPDHAAAQAMAARIAAAGFSDYYVVPDGSDANSIALGRYGNADAATRRQSALKAAGFDAQAGPLGAPAHWLLVAATRSFDADAARIAIGAGQRQEIPCTGLH